MNAIERLLVKDACIELMTGYCTHLDERHEEQFLALFTVDAQLCRLATPAYTAVGHEGIRRTFAARPASILSRHMMLNHAITVADDRSARATALGIVVRGNRDREDWPMPIRGLELMVQYTLEFRRDAEHWRISRCEIQRLLDIEAAPLLPPSSAAAASA